MNLKIIYVQGRTVPLMALGLKNCIQSQLPSPPKKKNSFLTIIKRSFKDIFADCKYILDTVYLIEQFGSMLPVILVGLYLSFTLSIPDFLLVLSVSVILDYLGTSH